MGSEPGEALNPVVVQVLHDRGLRTDGERPTLLTPDDVQAADVVVTMGCGETCPSFRARPTRTGHSRTPRVKT